ncbi:hypothetical protein ACFLUR_00560 [Chloroflexota bacterium]
MEEYISQLRETYKEELYYFTLMGTLALIDICAALNSPDGETNGDLFKGWFNKYLSHYSSGSSGTITSFYADECYKLRCRFMHQGRASIDARSMDSTVKSGAIAFRVGPGKVHMCNFSGIYYLDIETFMEDVIAGVKIWTIDVKDVVHVKENREKMVKILNYDPGKGIGNGIYIA